MLGKNCLTLANRLNSSRGLMFSSQIDQIVPLEHPESPLMFTNYENIVGKYSSAYYKSDKDYEVIRKFSKFKSKPNDYYILLVYNKKKNLYDVIYRLPGENLTETYGYKYDNSNIDDVKEGDKVKKNDVLFHSTSFDELMNYRYGVNAKTLYITDPMTIEDGIVICRSLANKLYSYEYDKVRIPVNDNDFFANLYGKNGKYKGFPDIGQKVKRSILAYIKRLDYSEALFDLKEDNLTKILPNDSPYYVPFAEDRVVDITIYCNKKYDEIKDTKYNKQIRKYYKQELEFYQDIYDTFKAIKDNGDKYSDDFAELYSRVESILDDEVKCEENDKKKIFSNMIVEFLVEKRVPVVVGSKLCGRYGKHYCHNKTFLIAGRVNRYTLLN